MKANVRFMKAPSRIGKVTGNDWETLQILEGIEDPILPPIGGSYRVGPNKYRVNEINYGYTLIEGPESGAYFPGTNITRQESEVICLITVEVSYP